MEKVMESHGILTIHKCLNPGQGKVFEFLKLTAEPMVMENLKRSCKKSWKVMEFEELKRVQTLPMGGNFWQELFK